MIRNPTRAPDTAWPTLALFTALWSAWVFTLVLGLQHRIPPAGALLVCSLVAYASYTPAHEAIHRSLSRSFFLNGLVGRLSMLFLMGPYLGLRRYHLEHHRHTNEGDADPDHWCGRGNRWLLPLRWLTLDLHFHWRFFTRSSERRSAGRAESAEILLTLAGLAILAAAAFRFGYARIALFHWILPARIAIGLLAFAFDYLPHRPHDVPAAEDRYRATQVIDSSLLNFLFLGQNYHLVHHLYPGIPFYRYRSVWRIRGPKLKALGAIETRLAV